MNPAKRNATKLPGKHLQRYLHSALLFMDQGHHPLSLAGIQPKPPAGRLRKELQQIGTAVSRFWHRLRPDEYVRTDLRAFSQEVAKVLFALYVLKPQDNKSVQLAENALIALVMRYEDGPLAHGPDLQQLYTCHVNHQWKRLELSVREQIQTHAGWLIYGSGDGQIRTFPPRIENRRMGFGWYEDYFRHMSAADYANHLRGCQILTDHGPALLQLLLRQH